MHHKRVLLRLGGVRTRFILASLQGLMLLGCSESGPTPAASAAGTSTDGGSAGSSAATGGSAAAAAGGEAGSGGTSLGGSSAGGTSGGSGGTAGDGAGGTGPVVSSLPGCQLTFPYDEEPGLGTWLGGDSAYSTTLSPTTALWSFQDTFIGKPGQTARQGSFMIANTMAIVGCENGVGSIEYVWRMEGTTPHAIFEDGTANQRFWPQQPIIYKGFLFAAMTRVQNGADEVGTTLARVSNPYDSPADWQIEYFDLSTLSGLGKGTLIEGEYAYLFGNSGQAVVTRLALEELIKPAADPQALLEYLATDGSWKPGLVTADAKKLGFSANVGTSFRYLEESAQWLVLFNPTSSWPARSVAISRAPRLEGPWTKPVDVYQLPEMTNGSPEYDADNVCYAAIEHNESNPNPERDLLFSYTCNSFVFEKQLANMAIYLPKVVKLKNPMLP